MCITGYDKERIALLFKEEGYAEGLAEGRILMLKKLVNEGALSLPNATKAAGMSVDEFQSYTIE